MKCVSWSDKRVFRIVSTLISVAMFVAASVRGADQNSQPAKAPLKRTLTIYVYEGKGERNGHVFVELSVGKSNLYYGFYPDETFTGELAEWPAPLGLAGSDVKDDKHLVVEEKWDVKKPYDITKAGYANAVRHIEEARSTKSWSLACHCGDFAEAVANAAGVPLHLPASATGRTRPELFGEYLRAHGGTVRQAKPSRAACLSECQNRWANAPDDLFSNKWFACNNACPR